MRTIIAGSRTVKDAFLIDRAIAGAKLVGIVPTIVLSGGQKAWDSERKCWFGADYLGEQWARQNKVPIERYPAKWKVHGKAAGPIRNDEMVSKSQALITIWDGKSRGTANVIRLAMTNGLLVHIEYF